MPSLINDSNFLKQKQDFIAYYQKEIRPIQVENDKIRQKYLRDFYVLLIMAMIFYPIILFMILGGIISGEAFEKNGVDYTGLIISISCFVIGIVCSPMYKFRKHVKDKITQKFADYFGNFVYEYERCIPDDIVRESKLFKQYDKSVGDDYFYGKYKDVEIDVAEEQLKEIYRDRRGRKRYSTIFDGMLIQLSMNKNFEGETVVKTDKGFMNILNGVRGMSRVGLEDSVFEKLFEVYSTDQVEARYILTTAFMERILHLRDLYGGQSIQLSFLYNRVLISIETNEDMFETSSFFKSNVNTKNALKVFEQFYTIFSIIDILKLNQKIGM